LKIEKTKRADGGKLRAKCFIALIIIIILSMNTNAQNDVDFNVIHNDPKNDVIYMIFTDSGIQSRHSDDKPHLDIKTAQTHYEDDGINFTMVLYNELKNQQDVRYEFQGWYNDSPMMFSMFNYFLSYSNGMTNISFDNGTVIDVSNYTHVFEKSFSVVLPSSFFLGATRFGFLAQSVEFDSGTQINYMDSTEPIEVLAEDRSAQISWFVLLIFITFFFVLYIIFIKKKTRTKSFTGDRCPKCKVPIEEKQEFCFSCGEYVFADKED
jgi:hypothetical protein